MLWIRHGSRTVEMIFSNLNSFFTFNWSKHNLLKYFSLNEIVLSSLLGFVYLSRAVKETCSFAELVMQFSFFFWLKLDWRIEIQFVSSCHLSITIFVCLFLSFSPSQCVSFPSYVCSSSIPICIILKESVCPSVVKIFSD